MTAAGVAVRESEARPFLFALLWLAALGPFFFLTYGFANWVTGLRQDVPSLAFGWERHIPFLAWSIVPYWSTDFFYVGALLLCRTRSELNLLGKRLFAVQLLCVTGFLIVPLRFSFERPHADGLFGRMFDALLSFDRPFNQAPSLHVALTAVLWAAYGRHLTGALLWFIRVWFAAMALSTLTTYQHHFIDVPTGLWVGLFTIMLLAENPPKAMKQARDSRRFGLGAAYLTAGLILGTTAFRVGGAAWLLIWPGAALSIVAAIYFAGRPDWFRKAEGHMPAAAIIVLTPYLLGAWLNSRWQTRGQAPAHEIADGVWLGRFPGRTEREALGIASIVDLTAELPIDRGGIAYRGVPVLDLVAPAVAQMEDAVRAIAELERQRPTLVCCALGYSRSAAAVAAWLVAAGKDDSVNAAIHRIRTRRPSIVLPERFRQVLGEWAAARGTK